jgi:hypothetical protein
LHNKGTQMDKREPISRPERHGELFEPDVVLPAQYFRVLRGRASYGGERRLIVAVLEDAINCFQKNLFARDNRGRRLFREAENWLMSADRELPFAFENICEFLSLDAECMRKGLCRWACAAQSKPAQGFDSEGRARRVVAGPVAASAMRLATVAAGELEPCAPHSRIARTALRS